MQEVSFYGNVFEHPIQSAVNNGMKDDSGMFACGGKSLQLECGGDAATFRAARSCGADLECKLQLVGPCRDQTDADMDACEESKSYGYRKCHLEANGDGNDWKKSLSFNEVVTVYLTEESFDSLYAGCVPLE
jgi:hypothetical protein